MKFEHWWHELTDEEKRAIHDPNDYPIISFIDGLSSEERKEIYNSIKIKKEYDNDFAEKQADWIKDLQWYLCKDKEVDGDNIENNPELCNKLYKEINGPFHERFRLYYGAKNPDRIEVIDVNRNTLEFLLESNTIVKVISSYHIQK